MLLAFLPTTSIELSGWSYSRPWGAVARGTFLSPIGPSPVGLAGAMGSRWPLPFRSLYLAPKSAPGAAPDDEVTVTVKLCVAVRPGPSAVRMDGLGRVNIEGAGRAGDRRRGDEDGRLIPGRRLQEDAVDLRGAKDAGVRDLERDALRAELAHRRRPLHQPRAAVDRQSRRAAHDREGLGIGIQVGGDRLVGVRRVDVGIDDRLGNEIRRIVSAAAEHGKD